DRRGAAAASIRDDAEWVAVLTMITFAAVVFFFQAEDGIRDRTVTGVQTCALPICRRPHTRREARSRPAPAPRPQRARSRRTPAEIGRASCRERVESSVVAGAVKKKKEEVAERRDRSNQEPFSTAIVGDLEVAVLSA